MALYELTEFASYVQDDVDTPTAQLLLELVTGVIEEVSGAPFDPVPATVKAIALEAAKRAYVNPKGLQSRTEAAGPFNDTERWNAADSGVYLTGRERAAIAAAANVESSSGVFSIDTFAAGSGHADICAINFGAGYCSCGYDLTLAYPLYEV